MSPLLGVACALGTAVSWASAVVLFKRSGEAVPPSGLNTFKNVVALVLFVPTLLLVGVDAAQLSLPAALWLLLSGALGIGLADTLFFSSLNLLGAGRAAIVDCLYSPFVVSLSMVMLGERLTALQAVGGTLVVGAVLAATYGPRSQSQGVVRGALLGAAAMALMAVSIVMVKPELEALPLMLSTSVRLVGGIAVLILAALVHGPTREVLRVAFRPQPAWRFALPGAVLGAYVALILWIGGFKYTSASIASILNQTSALYIVVLAAVFLREPLRPKHVVALGMALTGGALVLW